MEINYYNNSSQTSAKDYFSLDDSDSLILYQLARVMTIYVQPVICIAGLAGNIISLFIFLSKDLRKTSSNIYLGGLSACGSLFLVALFLVWLEVTGVRLVHEPVWCQSIVFVTYVCSFLTVWFVVCITVENYIFTFHLKKATYFCTVPKAKIIVCSVTAVGIVIYLFVMWASGVVVVKGHTICTESASHPRVTEIFTYIDTIVVLVLPSVILVMLIGAILIKHLWITRSEIRTRLTKKEKSLVKITRVLLAIGINYVVLSAPSYINKIRFIIMTAFTEVRPTITDRCLNQIFQIIFYMTFCANFLFYILWSVNFRRGLKRLFVFNKCCSYTRDCDNGQQRMLRDVT
ncbi:Somatostatin receptor type 4 [Mizuhopecten yessoensis]|uniref:Somatostatin receptor type 4 n=1 Tax=Mizuhopecten yessoensis TaxID=6573 RepID=A0A210QFU8_MIZYE|nr:Somatostatin receptor type 4 [Mizuhopecten yessoensis]